MAATPIDNGPSTNTPELFFSSNTSSQGVFIEAHLQAPSQPNSNASASGSLGPCDFAGSTDATAAPNSAGNATVFVQIGAATSTVLARMKNPG